MPTFDLVPHLEGRQYQIKDYDQIFKSCITFINETIESLSLDSDIKDINIRDVKEARKEIRKRLDLVKRVRIDCGKIALELFNNQTKALEIASLMASTCPAKPPPFTKIVISYSFCFSASANGSVISAR